jgi:carbamoyl-phosphate synthase small subunit
VIEGKTSARLVFADGTTFDGWLCAAVGSDCGQTAYPVEYNTAVVGYQELITDPVHKGKILVMTMPQIGNYGVNSGDNTSPEVQIAGLVVREMCYEPSNFRSEQSLPDFLKQHGVVALDGVDTRAVTLYLRDNPGQTARIVSADTGAEAVTS